MKIVSRILGEIEIEESTIINFPGGIPGFEDEKQFVIIPLEENAPFYYLQAVNSANLCLLMADPFIFFPDYQIELPDEEIKKLGEGAKAEDIVLYAILNTQEDLKNTTANLIAPIIINISSKKGLQFIAQKSAYNIRHPLFQTEQEKQVAATREGR